MVETKMLLEPESEASAYVMNGVGSAKGALSLGRFHHGPFLQFQW